MVSYCMVSLGFSRVFHDSFRIFRAFVVWVDLGLICVAFGLTKKGLLGITAFILSRS